MIVNERVTRCICAKNEWRAVEGQKRPKTRGSPSGWRKTSSVAEVNTPSSKKETRKNKGWVEHPGAGVALPINPVAISLDPDWMLPYELAGYACSPRPWLTDDLPSEPLNVVHME